MSNLSFTSEKEELGETSCIVTTKISGVIDGTTVRQFEDQLANFCSHGYQKLILNLSEVKYINSTGMGILVKLADKFQTTGGAIKLVKVPENVVTFFNMLGLISFFKIYENEFEARDAFLQNGGPVLKAKQEQTLPPPRMPVAQTQSAPPVVVEAEPPRPTVQRSIVPANPDPENASQRVLEAETPGFGLPKQIPIGAVGTPESELSSEQAPRRAEIAPTVRKKKAPALQRLFLEIGMQSLPLDQPLIDIGNHPGRVLYLDADSVSLYHATIENCDDSLFIRDENSLHGTFLNDRKLVPGTNYPLKKLDKVRIGKVSGKILAEDETDLAGILITGDDSENEAEFLAPDPDSSEEENRVYSFPQLICLTNSTIYELSDEENNTIGCKDCAIQIQDESLSPKHCIIRKDKKTEQYFIYHVGKTQTIMNRIPLPFKEFVCMANNAQITCGEVAFYFFTGTSPIHRHLTGLIQKLERRSYLPSVESIQRVTAGANATQVFASPGYETAYLSIPKDKGNGDFFSILRRGDDIYCLMGDVMNHGIGPALIAQKILGAFKSIVLQTEIPFADIPMRLNEILSCYWNDFSIYVSALFLKLSESQMEWVSASSPPPVFLTRQLSNEYFITKCRGTENIPWLGTFPADIKIKPNVESIQPGYYIVFYTDGIYELSKDGVGIQNMSRLIEDTTNQTPGVSPARLVTSIVEKASSQFSDDATIAVFKRVSYRRVCRKCSEEKSWPAQFKYCPEHGELLKEVQ